MKFVHAQVDKSRDDGLTSAIFADAYVSERDVPSFVFFKGCLELRKWRYSGADIGEIVRRLRRIVADDRLDDGPDAEPQ